MEKNIDYNTCLMNDVEKAYTVKIADDVVAMIATIAATEVEGVAGTGTNVTKELLDRVGVKNQLKGVKVSVADKIVDVDLSLVMEYGYNIPTICSTVQTKVKQAIENMTGLEVNNVDIHVTGINLAKDKA